MFLEFVDSQVTQQVPIVDDIEIYTADNEKVSLTVSCCKPIVKYFAPIEVMLLDPRDSLTSAYLTLISVYELNEHTTTLTVLCCNAQARCNAPVSPIKLFWIVKVVSDCIERYRCIGYACLAT